MTEKEKNDEMLKSIISRFYQREYDCTAEEEDFADPQMIPIAYGNADDLDDVEIQAYVDVEDYRIIRTVNGCEYETMVFKDATELATYIFWASFCEMIYIDPELALYYHRKAQDLIGTA